MWRKERLTDVVRRERADPRFRIEATWCSLLALLLVFAVAAGSVWAAWTFLPAWEGGGIGRQNVDYRLMLGSAPVLAYPWVHGWLRRLSGR